MSDARTCGDDSAPSREELAERQKSQGQGYWSIVWTQLKKNRPGMVGLAFIALVVLTAVFAPLIANDRPVVATYKGDLKFPAFTTYVDIWVPWGSVRSELKSFELTERYFPFSDHYEELEGRSWKQARAEEADAFGLAVWPPVEWNPQQFDEDAIKLSPGDEIAEAQGHLLGTDDQGRDVLARIIHGCVVATLVGVVAMGVATTIGLILGVLAGYLGGWTDLILSRIVEVVICFPAFFLIIAVISFLERSIVNIMLVIGLIRWTGIFRLVRGEVLKARGLDYVISARALGVPAWRVMFKHLLPNSVAPVFVSVAFGIAGAVLTESSLSFLGFGDPSVPSWGEIIQQGRKYVSEGRQYLVIYPGIAVFVTLTAFNLFGQGLRDAMDPRLRR